MSIQGFENSLLYKLDSIIDNKLQILLADEEINESYPDLSKVELLQEPFIHSTCEAYECNEMPRDLLLEIVKQLKFENLELFKLLNQVNDERKVSILRRKLNLNIKVLKQRNFKLMVRLFSFENFKIESFDQDFNRFLSKTIFVNYEISKLFLEKERENVVKALELVKIKDQELFNLKSKITLLEQVSLVCIMPLTCEESYREQENVEENIT